MPDAACVNTCMAIVVAYGSWELKPWQCELRPHVVLFIPRIPTYVAGRRLVQHASVDKSVLHTRRRRRCALACGPVPTWTEGRVVARGEWSHLGRGA